MTRAERRTLATTAAGVAALLKLKRRIFRPDSDQGEAMDKLYKALRDCLDEMHAEKDLDK